MLREIVLLTGAREAPHLSDFLRRHNPALVVTHVETRDDLVCAWHPARPAARLVAFCTSVIVPGTLLETFEGLAYNFHPGPPTYPGRHPASFAIYESAARFGVTLHEMRRQVDSGPIAGVEWFDMPAKPRLSELEGLSFEAAVRLFQRHGPALATSPSPLPHAEERWSGWTSRQRDFDAKCVLPLDIDADEFDRRFRAFADGLNGTLNITLHGHRFRAFD
ncbi:MAG TPA: formyltransferase family protein [Alphaproteobacteria bacterium]